MRHNICKNSDMDKTIEKIKKQHLQIKLENAIADILLTFAPLCNELTTSDLQGVSIVKAKEIINIVRKEY